MSAMPAGTAAVWLGSYPEYLPSSCPQTLLVYKSVWEQKCSLDRAMTTVYQMCEFGGFVFR